MNSKFYAIQYPLDIKGVYATWEEVKNLLPGKPAVHKSFRNYKDALAFANEYTDTVKPNILFASDCWRNGNTSEGGGRLVYVNNNLKEIIFEIDPQIGHTHNYYELLSIGRSLKWMIDHPDKLNGCDTLYTDSRVCLSWIQNKIGKVDLATQDRREILYMVDRIKSMVNLSGIKVKKWLTECWGEIPADYNRK